MAPFDTPVSLRLKMFRLSSRSTIYVANFVALLFVWLHGRLFERVYRQQTTENHSAVVVQKEVIGGKSKISPLSPIAILQEWDALDKKHKN